MKKYFVIKTYLNILIWLHCTTIWWIFSAINIVMRLIYTFDFGVKFALDALKWTISVPCITPQVTSRAAGGGGDDIREFLQYIELESKTLDPPTLFPLGTLAATACTASVYHASECMLAVKLSNTTCVYHVRIFFTLIYLLVVFVTCFFWLLRLQVQIGFAHLTKLPCINLIRYGKVFNPVDDWIGR